MSLKKKYQTLNRIVVTQGDEWTGGAITETKTAFKGLIQPNTTGKSYTNGNDTTFIPAIMFTSKDEVFKAGDKIENVDGTIYLIGSNAGQGMGVTGIKPKRGQHAEYNLVYANGSL